MMLRSLAPLLFVACASTRPADVTLVTPPRSSGPSTAPPAPLAAEIDFEHRIRLARHSIVVRDRSIVVTLVWRCDEPVQEEAWAPFVHVTDGAFRSDVHDGAPTVHTWTRGSTHVDVETFPLRADVVSPVTVYAGFWNAEKRLHVVSGPSDDEDRGIVGTIDVTPP